VSTNKIFAKTINLRQSLFSHRFLLPTRLLRSPVNKTAFRRWSAEHYILIEFLLLTDSIERASLILLLEIAIEEGGEDIILINHHLAISLAFHKETQKRTQRFLFLRNRTTTWSPTPCYFTQFLFPYIDVDIESLSLSLSLSLSFPLLSSVAFYPHFIRFFLYNHGWLK